MIEAINAVVRPFVTIMFTIAVTVGFLRHNVTTSEFLALLGPVFGYWFMQRAQGKIDNNVTTNNITKSS